jgi:hypothetical protein
MTEEDALAKSGLDPDVFDREVRRLCANGSLARQEIRHSIRRSTPGTHWLILTLREMMNGDT